MREELDKKLCKDHPQIFRDRHGHMSETCMCWGFTCGDGWYHLIEEICQKMEEVKQKTGIQCVAGQVKEKFGMLRFYWHFDGRALRITKEEFDKWYNDINNFVHDIENKSGETCELCGVSGELRKGLYMRTLCDACEEERNNIK